MDRGFACAATFHFMVAYNKPFVCCVIVGFNKQVQAFVASDSVDNETEYCPVEFTINKTESIVNQVVKPLADDLSGDTSHCFTQIKRG